MRIQVNGEAREIPEGENAAGLLARLGIQPGRVAVEVNLKVLERKALAETALKEGDQVEIVTFVGGGSGKIHNVQK